MHSRFPREFPPRWEPTKPSLTRPYRADSHGSHQAFQYVCARATKRAERSCRESPAGRSPNRRLSRKSPRPHLPVDVREPMWLGVGDTPPSCISLMLNPSGGRTDAWRDQCPASGANLAPSLRAVHDSQCACRWSTAPSTSRPCGTRGSARSATTSRRSSHACTTSKFPRTRCVRVTKTARKRCLWPAERPQNARKPPERLAAGGGQPGDKQSRAREETSTVLALPAYAFGAPSGRSPVLACLVVQECDRG